jgi:hypothetical protein
MRSVRVLGRRKKLIELSIKSPCLHPVFGLAFILYPLFQWYPERNEILLNLGMKC